MTSATGPVELVQADGVCWITLRRPEAFNALDAATASHLLEALRDAATNEDVRVVVLRGSGGSFCAGLDLTSAGPVERLADVGEELLEGAAALVRAVLDMPKPVVAAVDGVAAGVGASLCFAADLSIAHPSASFLLAFSRVGLMPDGAATATVAASVGRARAMRLALLGETLDAPSAFQAGLVSHLTDEGDFDAVLGSVVGRLASGPPLAFTATKRAVNAATLPDLPGVLGREKSGQLVLLRTEDAVEGMQAFLEKRRPRFSGR